MLLGGASECAVMRELKTPTSKLTGLPFFCAIPRLICQRALLQALSDVQPLIFYQNQAVMGSRLTVIHVLAGRARIWTSCCPRLSS
eukprot:1223195-Rhodomonas_salina.1